MADELTETAEQPEPAESGAQETQAAQTTPEEGTSTPDDEGAQTPETTPQEKMVSEKRFKEVYWQWKQAEREKEELAAKVKEAPQTDPRPQAPSDKPKIENFDDYATYNEALVDWKLAQERKKYEQDQQKATRQQRFQDFDSKIAQAVVKDPEFEKKAYIPTPMLDHFVEAEDPVALALYFGQHKDEAISLANLPPLATAREIGKIEARLAAKSAEPAQRFKTNAPDPTAPVDGKTKVPTDTSNMKTAQWIAHRDALTAKGELY